MKLNEHNSAYLSKITNVVSFILKWNTIKYKALILNVESLKILFYESQ